MDRTQVTVGRGYELLTFILPPTSLPVRTKYDGQWLERSFKKMYLKSVTEIVRSSQAWSLVSLLILYTFKMTFYRKYCRFTLRNQISCVAIRL